MRDDRLVYSTDTGRVDDRRKPSPPPPSAKQVKAPAPPDDGVVRLFREKGNRGGKTVTVIRGLPQRGAALNQLAGELKRLCGAGGTLRDGAIEIQGDHRERIAECLRSKGHTVKLAGG